MKLTNKIVLGIAVVSTVLVSCNNQDIEFSDFDYQTVYFAKQYPIRTLELGEDENVDLTLDNQRKVKIMATMGGVYANRQNRIIDIQLAENLCDNLYFEGGITKVVPMPKEYYKLASNQIVIPSGSIMGGVEVQLTDAFFEDEHSLSNNYVIPLVMTQVEGADSILSGNPMTENPDRCVSSDWNIAPKDFVLYGIKYVNPWHGKYLRRGIDLITDNGTTTSLERHETYVEDDEIVGVTTKGLQVSELPLTVKDNVGNDLPLSLTLNFGKDSKCVISGNTETYEVTGTGKFVSKGEKNSMGGKDRDAIYLEYQINFKERNLSYVTKDTLVLQTRNIAPETFKVIRK